MDTLWCSCQHSHLWTLPLCPCRKQMQKRKCMQGTELEKLKSISESFLVQIIDQLMKITITVKDRAIGCLCAKMSVLM